MVEISHTVCISFSRFWWTPTPARVPFMVIDLTRLRRGNTFSALWRTSFWLKIIFLRHWLFLEVYLINQYWLMWIRAAPSSDGRKCVARWLLLFGSWCIFAKWRSEQTDWQQHAAGGGHAARKGGRKGRQSRREKLKPVDSRPLNTPLSFWASAPRLRTSFWTWSEWQ